MTSLFKAEAFQNRYLPAGAREVHAIVSITSEASAQTAPWQGARTFGVLCDVSGSMEGVKLQAAKDAMVRLVQVLPADCRFFLAACSDGVHLLCPPALADKDAKARALQAISGLRAFGGTRISNWLAAALEVFRHSPEGVRQAVLLTDGQNDPNDAAMLQTVLQASEGVFQCDCRGIGTDWQVEQLRPIASRLLGTVDIIASPWEMEADFRAVLDRALARTVSHVTLRLWSPQGAVVRFCKQVSPQILDLTARARVLHAQLREYPTGAWSAGETRDFHLCVEVSPGALGDEILAGRLSVIVSAAGTETKAAEARMLAIWTDDEARSAKIHRVVAHYTGQSELAQSIQGGLQARDAGDAGRATELLGKAVRIAHASGNEATAKLLRKVVDVQDAATGTVRLRPGVDKGDAMALDTRSTRTARIARVMEEV